MQPRVSKPLGGSLASQGEAPPAALNGAAILERFQISNPALEALYHVHRLLFAILYKMDAAGTGTVSYRDFQLGCRLMARRFPTEAQLCGAPKDLLGLIGLKGVKEVSLATLLNAFRVGVRGAPVQVMLTPHLPTSRHPRIH